MHYSSEGERCPGSQDPRNTTKSQGTINLTQEIPGERCKRVAASAQARKSKELSRRRRWAGQWVSTCPSLLGVEHPSDEGHLRPLGNAYLHYSS